jgi:hypothetical protein
MMRLIDSSGPNRQLSIGQQFLVIYKFTPSSMNPDRVEVIGMIILKEEDLE